MEVVRIYSDGITDVLDLALEVFMEYEAPVYSQEGIDEFKSFIDVNRTNSKLSFYGVYEASDLVGMIAIRDYQHISLFFIKTAYQRKGIGRLIFNRVREDYEKQIFTVNSSPYAVDIYKRLGFMPISAERITNGIKYTPMVLLESERLRLKRYEIDDFKAVYSIFSNPDTMKHYPHAFSKEETINWINRNIKRYDDDGFGLWPVVLKSSGEVIGDCGITMQNINGEMLPEIGYHIHEQCQGMGYASEAARICIDYAFHSLNIPALYSYMKYTNVPSCRVAEKCGMTLIDEYHDPINIKTNVYCIENRDKE